MKKNILSITSLLIITLYSTQSFGEIRKYQYININQHPNDETQKRATITISSLPATSKSSYNGGEGYPAFNLLRTWHCPGVTKRGNNCNPKKIFKN